MPERNIPGPAVSFLRLSERIAGTVTWPEPPAETAEQDTTTGEEPAA